MARRALQLVVAVFLAAAAGLVLPSGPAAAATCSGADGVSVVVDFHELGGGVQSACVTDGGGRNAASLFEAAGFALDFVQRQPGFVCRVSGQPASDPCVNTPPADAYWGLYWADGATSRWTYATLGAGSQTVPDGGSVALSWTGSSARSQPGIAPAVHQKASSPSAEPTQKPTRKPTPKPTPKPSATPTPTASASASTAPSPTPTEPTEPTAVTTATRKPAGKASGRPTVDPGKPTKSPGGVDSEMLPEDGETTPTAAESDDDGLPTWVGPTVVAVLFAAGAAVAVVRRRRTPS
ncbi:hypothetical protein [Nocardioides sp. YIM 152315]|uniref:hypothetical protein n=1 Tax=Nocardioides sp. YIM 152315 TaxID=3031760 RepID=UPI0023DC4CAD|nr:hypothetical protein [Nocardioides sp. YIM 152315]MDF1605195.1 hypothetical protein [Nocardioides sp. YIM 152315]